MKKFVIITGASGSGKTSILNLIKEHFAAASCVHFDSVGVPVKKR